MRAGQLRHRVTIQQLGPVTRDAMGGEIATWNTYAELYAAVEPLEGRELFSAQQVAAEISHRVRIRYHAGVVPKMRVLFGSRVFDIQSAMSIEERGRETHLYCREVN